MHKPFRSHSRTISDFIIKKPTNPATHQASLVTASPTPYTALFKSKYRMPAKPPRKRRSYETKRKIRQQRRRDQNHKLRVGPKLHSTPVGIYNLAISAIDGFAASKGLPKTEVRDFAAERFGRMPSSIGSLVRRARANYTSTGSYDIFVSPRERTAQFDVVRETLDGYFDKDGNMRINPTYKQYFKDIKSACSKLGLRNMSTKTVWKYTSLFDWGFKAPSTVNNLDKKETMEKRVDFSTLLLQLAKNNTCELLFCDEMSFLPTRTVQRGWLRRIMKRFFLKTQPHPGTIPCVSAHS